MNKSLLNMPVRGSGRRMVLEAAVLAFSMLGCAVLRADTPVDLGAASSFGVLASTAITNVGFTAVTGDIGTYSGTAVTGIGTMAITGVNHNGDPVTQSAHSSLLTAIGYASGLPVDFSYSGVADLGGLTLGPGVHFDATAFEVNGILTLNGMGDSTAVWVFQMGTTLTTSSGSSILLINGAQASNVFWQVGSSATLGGTTDFAGSILASESITLGTGAVIQGRALAYNGAVEMSGNAVTVPVPEPALSLLAGAALLGAAGGRRRK